MGCDTVLPDGHERPAVERDPVAHHLLRASLTEQTNGRAMDAQPKQEQRLVPSHLSDAEHVITSASDVSTVGVSTDQFAVNSGDSGSI